MLAAAAGKDCLEFSLYSSLSVSLSLSLSLSNGSEKTEN